MTPQNALLWLSGYRSRKREPGAHFVCGVALSKHTRLHRSESSSPLRQRSAYGTSFLPSLNCLTSSPQLHRILGSNGDPLRPGSQCVLEKLCELCPTLQTHRISRVQRSLNLQNMYKLVMAHALAFAFKIGLCPGSPWPIVD